MEVPQEMAFLQEAGLGSLHILLFGAAQVGGGVLMLVPRTKIIGTMIVIIALVYSAVLLFNSGDASFGLFSIIPVILAGVVLYQSWFTENSQAI